MRRVAIGGDRIRKREVLIFDLVGHPTAARCYAWEIDGVITTLLEEGPVQNEVEAVRKAIAAHELGHAVTELKTLRPDLRKQGGKLDLDARTAATTREDFALRRIIQNSLDEE